jgi:hypothetical protein
LLATPRRVLGSSDKIQNPKKPHPCIIHKLTCLIRCRAYLQAGAVDDLHVDTKLAASVVENEDADTAAARVKGGLEALPQVGLVHDGEVLLDITSLGHGNNYQELVQCLYSNVAV